MPSGSLQPAWVSSHPMLPPLSRNCIFFHPEPGPIPSLINMQLVAHFHFHSQSQY